jgi:hypothetical protein
VAAGATDLFAYFIWVDNLCLVGEPAQVERAWAAIQRVLCNLEITYHELEKGYRFDFVGLPIDLVEGTYHLIKQDVLAARVGSWLET